MKTLLKTLHVANQDNAMATTTPAVLVITSSNPPSDVARLEELDVLVTDPIKNGELVANFLKATFGPATLREVKANL